MGLFDIFFASKELPVQLRKNDSELLRIWKEYRGIVDEKAALIDSLTLENLAPRVSRLQQLLKLELAELEGEVKTEEKLIAELDSLTHEQRLNRIERMERALCYYETRHKYVFELLNSLHQTLLAQSHIVGNLASANEQNQLMSHLKSQSLVEQELIKKIEERSKFHEMFITLIKGEKIIERLDATEQKLVARMNISMRKAFANRATPGIVTAWIKAVQMAVKNEISILSSEGRLDSDTEHWDIEYVNRPAFADVVRATVKKLRARDVSDEMINVFVHIYREWFTYEAKIINK